MPKASDMQAESRISALFKGGPGLGKTIAACSMAVDGPVFLAYHDKNRPVELLNFFKKHRPELLQNIDYEVYGSANANDYINQMLKFTNDCRYIGVITDSVTSLTSNAVNWSLGFEQRQSTKNQFTKPSEMEPDWKEYKVETSMVTQALDACKKIPAHIIWIAHPVPKIRIEGAGKSQKITKETSIVTYGNKTGGLIQPAFNEIYHFAKEINYNTNPTSERRIVLTKGIEDDFAKTVLGLPDQLDITDKLFWEVWKDAVKSVNGGNK